jgi:hypothetical protein
LPIQEYGVTAGVCAQWSALLLQCFFLANWQTHRRCLRGRVRCEHFPSSLPVLGRPLVLVLPFRKLFEIRCGCSRLGRLLGLALRQPLGLKLLLCCLLSTLCRLRLRLQQGRPFPK